MKRETVAEIYRKAVLPTAARLFGTLPGSFKSFPHYEGAQNLVCEYQVNGRPLILRTAYSGQRTVEQIRAELDFVNYLAANGVRVSVPVASANGSLVETVAAEGIEFHLVSFVKGKGMRVPDNGYRYRTDAPIEEYFQNWGQVLGQMHRLARSYQPDETVVLRPEWFELRSGRFGLDFLDTAELQTVRDRILAVIEEIKALPHDREGYGLIHGDFNDGNFTVDYTNGDLTVFDFDDTSYFWFVHELAAAWEGGVGRIMFESLRKRKAFMDEYMAQVMEGYQRENYLPDKWLACLPLFISLVQIDEYLYYARHVDHPDSATQARMDYKVKCIKEQIPYMGFFDQIYSPEKPFSL